MSKVLALQTWATDVVDDTRGSDYSWWSCDDQGSHQSFFACG